METSGALAHFFLLNGVEVLQYTLYFDFTSAPLHFADIHTHAHAMAIPAGQLFNLEGGVALVTGGGTGESSLQRPVSIMICVSDNCCLPIQWQASA